MNDEQNTVASLKLQECPGGGWNGMPAFVEKATVADCLANGVCGCIYGDAAQHIANLRTELDEQACLNGMGAEREMALRGEIERLRRRAANAEDTVLEQFKEIERLRSALKLGREAVVESFDYATSLDDTNLAEARLRDIDAALGAVEQTGDQS